MGIAALDIMMDHPAWTRSRWAPERDAGMEWRKQARWSSRHGFAAVELRDDRTGYVALRRFEGTIGGRITAVAALARLAHVDRLILDLRDHEGGDESMAAFITSLLFDTEPLFGDEVYAPATQPLPLRAVEPRCTAQRIDVLVSATTSPLGLAFAANLERLGRAALHHLPPDEYSAGR
jgi:hypothetical protein